jgi:putative PIN family toxin of toxin-antitoxin system
VRAVLDPHVLISAVLSRVGAPAQIVVRWLAGEFELVVSPLLLAELERALAYPKLLERIPASDAAEFCAVLLATAVVASDPPLVLARSADAGDDYLLALAEAERAILVSGDRHLLALGADHPIQRAVDFLEALRREWPDATV